MGIGKIFKFLNFRGQRTEDSSLRSVSLKNGSANEPCEQPKPMDWSRLPDELKYLCGPVEKFFPYYQDEMTMADARNEMPAEDWEELKAVGQKIRENRHFPLIDQWITQEDMEGASANLYFFTGLLDLSDIPFQ